MAVYCLDKKLQGCCQRLLCTAVPIQRVAEKLGLCWLFLHWDLPRTFSISRTQGRRVFSSLASISTSGGCMDQGNKRCASILSWMGVLVLVVGLMVAGTAQSQIISGDLVGTVYDKTGAVVPNATIEATNVDTNVKITTQAN